jgi:hypothetical protein
MQLQLSGVSHPEYLFIFITSYKDLMISYRISYIIIALVVFVLVKFLTLPMHESEYDFQSVKEIIRIKTISIFYIIRIQLTLASLYSTPFDQSYDTAYARYFPYK